MRTIGVVALLAWVGCAGSEMQQHFDAASRCHYTDKNYACAIEHYNWMLAHGAGPDTLVSRGYAKRDSGDRAGAIADMREALRMSPTMGMHYALGNILADLDGIAQIGLADAQARSNPPLDLPGAEAELTACIGAAPRGALDLGEESTLILCFKGRRDVRAAMGQDSSGDDASFRRLACDQCNAGRACMTESGCSLNMSSSGGGGGGGGGGGDSSGSSSGDGAGAWYYSWSCTGECSPGQLAIKGTEGPFPTEEGCNAARSGDSHQQLVQQSGNVGSVGYCERR